MRFKRNKTSKRKKYVASLSRLRFDEHSLFLRDTSSCTPTLKNRSTNNKQNRTITFIQDAKLCSNNKLSFHVKYKGNKQFYWVKEKQINPRVFRSYIFRQFCKFNYSKSAKIKSLNHLRNYYKNLKHSNNNNNNNINNSNNANNSDIINQDHDSDNSSNNITKSTSLNKLSSNSLDSDEDELLASDKVIIQIGNDKKTFVVGELQQLSYFVARFSGRWRLSAQKHDDDNDGVQIPKIQLFPPNEKGKGKGKETKAKNVALPFTVEHLDLLLKCFKIKHIPYDTKCDCETIESLIRCYDYFSCNNKNKNIFTIDKECLVDYFRNCVPLVDIKIQNQLLTNSNHTILTQAINIFENERLDQLENMQWLLIHSKKKLPFKSIKFNNDLLSGIFITHCKITCECEKWKSNKNMSQVKISVNSSTYKSKDLLEIWKQRIYDSQFNKILTILSDIVGKMMTVWKQNEGEINKKIKPKCSKKKINIKKGCVNKNKKKSKEAFSLDPEDDVDNCENSGNINGWQDFDDLFDREITRMRNVALVKISFEDAKLIATMLYDMCLDIVNDKLDLKCHDTNEFIIDCLRCVIILIYESQGDGYYPDILENLQPFLDDDDIEYDNDCNDENNSRCKFNLELKDYTKFLKFLLNKHDKYIKNGTKEAKEKWFELIKHCIINVINYCKRHQNIESISDSNSKSLKIDYYIGEHDGCKIIVKLAPQWFPILIESNKKIDKWINNEVMQKLPSNLAFEFALFLTKFIVYKNSDNKKFSRVYFSFVQRAFGFEWRQM